MDGYNGQDAILFDDFYGGVMPYGSFLKCLDRYRFSVMVKGSSTLKKWKVVIITSNKPPNEWYPKYGLTEALKRRFTSTTQWINGESPPNPLSSEIESNNAIY